MNLLASVVAVLGLLSLGCGAQTTSGTSDAPQSAERSFTISIQADPDRVLKAFGPVEEKRWSPEWDPRFISLVGDRADPDFAVFRVTRGQSDSIWTLSNHDRKQRTIQYVVVNPGKMVTVIDIRCLPGPGHSTQATVAYRKIALTTELNPEISQFAAHFTDQREHWERTINDYFDGVARTKHD